MKDLCSKCHSHIPEVQRHIFPSVLFAGNHFTEPPVKVHSYQYCSRAGFSMFFADSTEKEINSKRSNKGFYTLQTYKVGLWVTI